MSVLFPDGLDQLRAAGEATRLRTLALLSEGDLSVSELTRALDQSQPRVSRHLRVLVDAGLIEPYQEGSWRFYRLGDISPWLSDFLAALDGPERDADAMAFEVIRRDRAAKAAQFFSNNAAQWDALRKLHIDDHLIEAAMLDAAPRSFDRFLDLGTGTGRMLTLFADRYRQGLGYDVSQEMLAIARVRLDDADVRHAAVRRYDFSRAGELPENSADVVSLHHVLHFLGEPDRAIAAASRVLSPRGLALIADFAPHTLEELRDQYAHRRLGFSDEEIGQYAKAYGMTLATVTTLKSETPGGLISKIWRLEKTAAMQPLTKEKTLA
ncbi:MAG: metalloregulator ArsR/SmtB family transcription factor [Pseudomonadota bacterium]